MIIKVFDIGDCVNEELINETQKSNIVNIFDILTRESHLITNCYLEITSSKGKESPIYYYKECINKNTFDYTKIARDLLRAELKADNTRNANIREGLLFIKAVSDNLTIMKLEKLEVIDRTTYKIKSELGKEKDYFKVAIFSGNYNDIKIIDKNKTAAKYWYEKFLKLNRLRNSEDNTQDVIDLINQNILYKDNINKLPNYTEIKRFTETYLFDNKKFDKSTLLDELNSSGLIDLIKEEEIFSEESKIIDSDFDISEKIMNKNYEMKIQTSRDIVITTKNYKESLRDNEILFDEDNKQIKVIVDDDYMNEVKDLLNGDEN
ncbi:hypothetical protein [uncultured Anaerococcus sp.]|uniref:hypothetical protein n=1 Tax=uncultured Anaerococcus sp. TaxID=293428 RepID=UPI0025E96C1D|nr:hypothetical protein [uncultured Anaerococcus sp.]